MNIAVSLIRMDGGTQPRASINPDVVAAYSEAMRDGVQFPPVELFYDGSDYWLADGFHRVRSAIEAGVQEIAANIRQGTLADAQWHSFAANQTNGLYRSNADKQRAIEAALRHPKSQGLSDREIGRHVGVSQPMVSSWREKLSEKLYQMEPPTERTVTRNGTTYQMNAENIGKKDKREMAIAMMKAEPAKPSEEIANALNASMSVVARWRKESGLPTPPKRYQNGLEGLPVDGPTTKRHETLIRANVERLLVGMNQIVGASSTLTALHLPAVAAALTPEQMDQVQQLIRRARKDIGIVAAALERKNGNSETDRLSNDAA